MNHLLRAGALSCALMTTTCLTTPALAQANQSAEPAHRGIDENGVDLINGNFPFTLVEGTIGSGDAMLAVTRTGGSAFGTSNWQNVYLYQTVSGSTTTVDVTLGDRSERFTSTSGGAFVAAEGNGATLTGGNHADFTYRDANGVSITFGAPVDDQNGASNLCSHINANQNGCYGLATSITQPNGAQLTFGWDMHSNCSTVFNPDGSLDCTHSWRLDMVGNSFGYSAAFAYATDTVTPHQNPSGDWFKRTGATLSNSVVSASSTIGYSYVSSTVTDVTDSGGRTWRLTSSGGNLTGIRRPDSTSDDISISYSGGVVSSVTRDGVTTDYSRSVSGSTATWTITYVDGDAATTDPQATVVVDLSLGRVTSVTDPLSHQTSYQYDSNARLTRVTQPEGNYTQLTYDSRGNVTETRMVAKSGSSLSDIVASASFPSSCSNPVTCNQPTSVTDARGNTTDFTYDGTHGGVLTVTAPAPTSGATRPQTRYGYTLTNGEYQPTSVSACASGAAPSCVGTSDESRTVVGYDANGNVTSVEQRSGNTTGTGALSATNTMTYDGLGNLVTVDGPLSGTADTTHFRYDSARQVVGIIGPDPDDTGSLHHRAVRTTYRSDGLPTKVEQGNVNSQSDTDWASFSTLQEIQTEYDGNDRPVVQRLVSGSTTYALTQTSYDGLGRVRCVAQRMNTSEFATSSLPADACTLDTEGSFGPDRIARTTYNAAGQVTKVETGVGVTGVAADEVTTAYTTNGQVDHVTDANGNRTTYEYDGHDRLAKTRFPVATAGSDTSATTDYEQLTLDAGGNVTARRLRDGNSIALGYDALNRLTGMDLSTGPDVTYNYDLLGRLTGASQTGHALTFAFDALGRQTSESGPLGTLSRQFDLADRLTSLTHPDSTAFSYQYNAAGDMTGIFEPYVPGSNDWIIIRYWYDDLGRRTVAVRGADSNGTTTAYYYDGISRLSTIAHDPPGTANDQAITFTYNPAGQIVSRIMNNDAYAFTGHANQNVTDTHNGLNQVTQTGGTTISHADNRGNVTAIGSAAYGYDSLNRLTSAPGSVTLGYDPLGRLYSVTSGSNTTRFLYDGADRLAEYNGSNVLQRRFVDGPGIDAPVATYDGSSLGLTPRHYPHQDERGSVVAVFNANGTLNAINRYDEYGVPQGTLTGRFGYTGQAWLPEAGLYDYRARMYNPSLGRFMQTDPIGFEGGMNWYAYALNDPINRRDPFGLDNCDDPTTSTIEVCGRRPCDPGFSRVGNLCVSDNVQLLESARGRVTVRVPGTSRIRTDRRLQCSVQGRQVTCTQPQPQEPCPQEYDVYAFGGSGTVALFLGLSLGVQGGFTMPHDSREGLRGMQFFVSGQGAGMLGLGAFVGGGPTASIGRSHGILTTGGSPFAYAEGDLGWGPSATYSWQGNPTSQASTIGLPVPRLGYGYGGYLGVGGGYGYTLATPPALCRR